MHQATRFGIARDAFVDMLPLSLAVVPWGILAGALAIQAGLSPLQAQCMSLLVFAGAAQLSATTLLSAGAATPGILASAFMISSRHLLYSLVFRQHLLQLSLPKRLAIGFLLTDEMFAVSEAHTRQHGQFSALYAFCSGLSFYLIWNIASFAGIILGESLHNLHELGLDFAIIATFIALTFDALWRKPVFIAIVVSGVLAVLLQAVAPDAYIVIAGLAGMVAAWLTDRFVAA